MQFKIFNMSEYTVILMEEWSKYGDDIKEVFHKNKLKWNSLKIKKLSTEDLVMEYQKFKVDDEFKINETMIGSSGIYENNDGSIAIKLIKAENIGETIIDSMLIVYKGIEEKFYIELMKKFRDMGCLIIKIVDDEIVFKDRINVKLINSINDIEGERKLKVKNFIDKTKALGELFGELYSDDFKNKWIKCIENN